MPITTPDEIEEKRYAAGDTNAPEVEFDGREMSTVEALEIVNTDLAGLWDAISEIERDGVTDDELREIVARQQERIEELEQALADAQNQLDSVAMRCNKCENYISMPWREPHRCSECGERLAWDKMENRLRGE